ncbi:MAG: DUF2399 domain-containing protein [Burkholderiaceae bacterium]
MNKLPFLRRLVRTPPDWEVADQIIYVCENPNIVSIAADRLGAACAPLVCTDGMPAAAQRVLLKQLSDAGTSCCITATLIGPVFTSPTTS